MTTETPTARTLRIGEEYQIGERVLSPHTHQERLVYEENAGRLIIIGDVVSDGEGYPRRIPVEILNLVQRPYGDGSPRIEDLPLVLEGDPEFRQYASFIQQHGGQAA